MPLPLFYVALIGLAAAAPTAKWPHAFLANFTETSSLSGISKMTTGYYAFDVEHGEAIYRVDGSGSFPSFVCKDKTPSLDIAVKGQRFMYFPEKGDCCTCCSYQDGCGPLVPSWVQNATYEGTVTIDGVSCDKFLIQGNSPNYMAQTNNGQKVCELNNGGANIFDFVLGTFTLKPSPDLFVLPDMDCSKRCTPVGPFAKYGPCGFP